MSEPSTVRTLPTALRSSVLAGPFEGTLTLAGRPPGWLRGRLLRTGAALFDHAGWSADYWFDGLGMMVSFEFGAGGSMHWRQRLLDCEFLRQVERGRCSLAGFGTPRSRSLSERLRRPIARATDNANVNVRPAGEHWIAMSETERQLSIDPRTLATLGELRFDDALPAGLLMGPHPHHDPANGEWINFGLAHGMRSTLVFFRQRDGSARREEIGRVPLGTRVSYMHSFALTARKVIAIMPPYTLSPWQFLGSRWPVAHHFRWDPRQATRIVVMDRASGRWTEHQCAPFFLFHTVHASDEASGDVHLDVLTYPDAQAIAQDLRLDVICSAGLPPVRARLQRLRLRDGRSEADLETIAPNVHLDFPSVNRAQVSGHAYRHVWGSDLKRIVRVDSNTGASRSAATSGLTVGEPVFVGRPGASEEDDGVLLVVAGGGAPQQSQLQILDAQSLEMIAHGTLPIDLPLTFHGNFAPH